MVDLVITVGMTLGLLALGIFIGGHRERRHFKDLRRREDATRHIIVNNLKRISDPENIRQAVLVDGEVVIATDYFKSLATALRNMVGGEMRAAQSLLARARREALLRMVEQAQALGAQEVWNVRFASSNIAQMVQNKGAMAAEMYAYGTAVVRK